MKFTTIILFSILLISQVFPQRVLKLEEALAIALKESYSIKSASFSLESSQKNLEAIKMGLRTSVNMEFDLPRYSRSLKSQFNTQTASEQFFEVGNTTLEGRLYFTQPIPFTNGTFSLVSSIFGRDQFSGISGTSRDYYTNMSLRLRQPLFSFNSLSASLERAEINLEKSKKNYSRSEQDLIYNVTSSFYQLFQAKRNMEIVQERVNQTTLSYEMAMNKYRAGLLAEVEALQLEVDLASAKNELLNAETRFRETKDNIKLLIGLPIDEEIDVAAEIEYKSVKIDLEHAIQSALDNRPELHNAGADINLSTLSIDEVNSKGNINALLQANYGINKNDDAFKDLFHAFAEDRSVSFTVSLPVWDWGKNSREVESAEANLKLSILTYEYLKEQIKKEIITLVNKVESSRARVEVLTKSVEVARKSYEISSARFESGNITSFDLTQSQLRLTDAQTNSLNALIDYKLAIADLKRKTFFDYEN
jgi:outer membrane protein TolC